MCGICGVFNYTNKRRTEPGVIEKMLYAIRHRGPDGSQVLILDEAALGFARLIFIDLSGGMQPLCNEDETITMVCNGEIYNYRELSQELAGKGHKFRTKTDVEVILHLYEEYGMEFPRCLNGQFAVALYDDRKKQLLLVRDHVGIAPLFYTVTDGKLVFASEIDRKSVV